MDNRKYIGMDVHQASISIAVSDAAGKVLMECIVEMKAATRPSQAEWFRSLRDQCRAARAPFHFKQWGDHNSELVRIEKKAAGRELDGRSWDGRPRGAA
jgi:protein gp37